MNSTSLSSFLPHFPAILIQSAPRLHPKLYRTNPNRCCCKTNRLSPTSLRLQHPGSTSIVSAVPSDEGTVSAVSFEDFAEKDWSFLDSIDANSFGQIVSAGEIEEASRVLVSFGSEEFVDRIVESSTCQQLLVVHDSLFVLACIKEKHDKVKCWQGELIYLPEKWAPFDAVFLYFLPALPFKLDQILGAIAKHCMPGARLVISHPQGREVSEQQRQGYPDVVIGELPDKTTLQIVGAEYSFEMVLFVDEPGFYLAVLKLQG